MDEHLTFRQIIDGLSIPIVTVTPDGRVDPVNTQLRDQLHLDDLLPVIAAWQRSFERGEPYELEERVRRLDGTSRWLHVRGLPLRAADGHVLRWCLLLTDIDDRKRTDALLDGEKRLLEMVASGCSLRDVLDAMCALVETIVSESTCSILLIDPNGTFRHGAGASLPPRYAEMIMGVPVVCDAGPCGTAASLKQQVVVPDLRADPRWDGQAWRTLVLEHGLQSVCSTPIIALTGKALGTFAIYQREPARPSPLLTGLIARFTHVASIAIERANSEASLARSEARVRRLVEADIIGIVIWDLEGRILEANDAFLDMVGRDRAELEAGHVRWGDLTPREWHQRDAQALAEVSAAGSVQPYEKEWLHKHGRRVPALIGSALISAGGNEGVAFVLDLSAQKRADAEILALKDQLYRENLVLRDEVDRTSMFEEIVGTSPALKPVLARVAKVAGTDSTVLIAGETGTGKELIARAIHRRSSRADRAFVSVNCAATPRDLIASELFGHEKGAFTGATQRRLGRFELAHGGTLFLDEVGELPMETQVALLRVLQEREFERVGGTTAVRVDVRVIAATNRDLPAAIESGAFRSDLFYRLNVFPIAMPALRERADDIPLLVEYFIDRYARKAGKTIRRVNRQTLRHLESYPWPGNVRELQNVIERSIIVCDTDEFIVDESWLSAAPAADSPALSRSLAGHEKAIIEEALRASGGRVFGPLGAAARLGIARSTLESKIRSLGIDKRRFRS